MKTVRSREGKDLTCGYMETQRQEELMGGRRS
jgi:hypothetical protein